MVRPVHIVFAAAQIFDICAAKRQHDQNAVIQPEDLNVQLPTDAEILVGDGEIVPGIPTGQSAAVRPELRPCPVGFAEESVENAKKNNWKQLATGQVSKDEYPLYKILYIGAEGCKSDNLCTGFSYAIDNIDSMIDIILYQKNNRNAVTNIPPKTVKVCRKETLPYSDQKPAQGYNGIKKIKIIKSTKSTKIN